MMIRLATIDDIDACVAFGLRMQKLTRFAHFPYEEWRVREQLRRLIIVGQQARKSHCLLLAEAGERHIVGGLMGCIESHIFSSIPVASLINYGVLPEFRMSGAALRLIHSFILWAKRRGAMEINAGINSALDIDKSGRFLEKLGFIRTGGNYVYAL